MKCKLIGAALLTGLSAWATQTTTQAIVSRTKSGVILANSLKRDVSDNGLIMSAFDSNCLSGDYSKLNYTYSGTSLLKLESFANGILDRIFTKEYSYDAQNNLVRSVTRKSSGDTDFTASLFFVNVDTAVGQDFRDSTGAVVRKERILSDSCKNSIGNSVWTQSAYQTVVQRKFIYGATCADTTSILTYSLENPGRIIERKDFVNHKLVSSGTYTQADTSVAKHSVSYSYPAGNQILASVKDIGLMGNIANKTTIRTVMTSTGNVLTREIRDDNGGTTQGRLLGFASWTYNSSDSIITYKRFDIDSVEACGYRVLNQRDSQNRVLSSVNFNADCDTSSITTITYSP